MKMHTVFGVLALFTAAGALGCGEDDSSKGGSGGASGSGAIGGAGAAAGGASGGSGTSGTGGGSSGSGGASGGGGIAGGAGTTSCAGIPPPPQTGGKTYWVAPDGSDTNDGSESAPFSTIQKGVDAVTAGDTVIVRDGVYTGAAGEPVVTLSIGGSADNFVWLKAEHPWGAKIDGQGTASEGISLANGIGWVRVQGFDVYAVAIDGSTTGIVAYSGGHDSEIIGNHIHDIGHICTDTANGLSGIFIQQPGIRIEANVIHDIGRFGPGEQGCTPSNLYWQNHDHGIYVDGSPPGASGAVIENNFFYNHTRGWAIQLYPGTLDGVSILNNTFAFPNPNRDGHIVIEATLDGLRIQNNVFFQPKTSALDTYGGPTLTDAVVEANLTDAAEMLDSTVPSGMTLAQNLTSTNPELVDPGAGDPHLKSGSPAIDKGVTLPNVPIDFDGCARPGGSAYDIGADEVAP